ncbi:pantoate--beta-alanine ligase [Bacterioplanes sanyensis]|uniref:Pantothenate synthetase n=1 Tax=Bacterioplanes sanyensis TaxID=1249553 RepID=A0A222FPJ3_9GAMM|nr:pantoate--beta-alanine ligase [Bacterioplanes sanyensis]ASP40710.1 pantoate--beta-alanine ligase [Bacterioplanes sanyensis]
MQTVHTIAELRQAVRAARAAGQTIGFVPTMGNLHDGHISLVERARAAGHFVVASIFVNPLQFDDASDLQRYPRTLAADQQRLSSAQCDLLFAPDVDEMYPQGQQAQSKVHVPVVSEGLCGGSRAGHFDGVATVVSKLFNQVQPDQAFFGQKDWQQVAVIRKLVQDLDMPIDIVAVPTARADDGLALSSRNGYLSDSERQQAPMLYRTLQQTAEQLQQGASLDASVQSASKALNAAGFNVDYVEIRRQQDLQSASENDGEIIILAAAFLGPARLIDNLPLSLNRPFE